MIPHRDSGNAYTVLLYRALESIGIRYVDIPFSLGHVWRQPPADPFHYLHFHWPEVFFRVRANAPHKLFGLKGYFHLHAFWDLAKSRGYRLVWTVHEVDVHDLERHSNIYDGSRRKLWRMADIVFTHSDEVRDAALRRWGPREHLHTVPHGDFTGAYPDSIDRDAARARLGLPDDALVFLFLGNIRSYKGINELFEAFRVVQSSTPRAHLVVAGRPKPPEQAEAVAARAHAIPNTHVHPAFVPDEDMQVYLRAADCFVAPYHYIETSGSIYLALTFGLPIITKLEGNVRAFEGAGIGYLLEDMGDIQRAMHDFTRLATAARREMQDNVRQAIRDYAWDRVAEHYRAAFAGYERTHDATALAASTRG